MSRRIAKEGIAVAVGQVAMVVVYAIGFRFVTEAYDPAVFGDATLLLGIVTFAFAIALNPLLATHLRFYPEYRERGLARWFDREVRRHLLRLTVAIGALGLSVALVWSVASGADRLLIGVVLIAALVTQTAFTFETDILSAIRHQGQLAFLRVVRVFAYPALAVLVAWLADPTVLALLVASAASFSLPWLVVRTLRWSKSPSDKAQPSSSESADFLRAAALYGGPFFIIAIATWVSSVGDRYVLALYLESDDVGRYAAIYGFFAQPFLMLAGGLSQWLRPILFDAVAEKRSEVARRVIRRWLAAALACSVAGGTVLWFTRQFWFDLLLAAEYHHQGNLVLFLIIANTMLVVTSALSHQLMAAKRTSAQLMPLATAAVTNIGCNIVLIPRYGVDGAGIATAISFSLHALLILVAVVRAPAPKPEEDSAADHG